MLKIYSKTKLKQLRLRCPYFNSFEYTIPFSLVRWELFHDPFKPRIVIIAMLEKQAQTLHTIMNILWLSICTSTKHSLLSILERLRSKTFLDTLSDILDKSLRFSLIKMSQSTQAKPQLVPSSHLLYILFY